VENENVPKKKSILKKLREKSSPISDKGHEDVVDDHFDFEFRADGRISAGDVQKSKGGASNSESGFGGASHIGTQKTSSCPLSEVGELFSRNFLRIDFFLGPFSFSTDATCNKNYYYIMILFKQFYWLSCCPFVEVNTSFYGP
jgi:hypothetical protein